MTLRDLDFTDADSSTSEDSLSCSSLKRTSEDSASAFSQSSNFLHDIPFKSSKCPALVSQSCDGTENMVDLPGKVQALTFSSAIRPKSFVEKNIALDKSDAVSAIPKMPLCKWMNDTPKYNGNLLMNPISANQEDEVKSMNLNEREKFRSQEKFLLDDFRLDQSAERDTFYNCDVISQPLTWEWNYDLSRNPVISKFPWLYGMTHSQQSFLPYFDFSSPEDPSQAFSRRLFSTSKAKESGALQNQICDDDPAHESNESRFDTSGPVKGQACSNYFVGNPSERVNGGGGWESHMMHSCIDTRSHSKVQSFTIEDICDLPIDVVVDKCIVQGILHQYPFVLDSSPIDHLNQIFYAQLQVNVTITMPDMFISATSP